ncbi:hypothetical protein F2Q70_00039352 [Brassica cretica]|uniref:Small EDRK-rich factor-like N-terminal domain-containing protein n=1 Tax=Brassica cretica TaxID=69181 RepID=A0A8S9KBG0_BRACR|nr:hypothetical protein F2Q70_00039352 [Brassica cretica]KAF3493290.1 hypothetical protein DY000_02053682 [Brassica cretica]
MNPKPTRITIIDDDLVFILSPAEKQRGRDRERAAARAGGQGKNADDGLTPEQRRERDGKALQKKAAKKAAQAAAAAASGGSK